MSDSEDFTVTCTAVSSPFGGLSDIRSPGVVGPEHEGLPWMLDDPYVQSPPPPDFVLEPFYPEFMPPEDEILLAEEQPLPATNSPTADSPDYVSESDPEEDPEEDNDEDPGEDPADYPADRGDDGNNEDEPSDDIRMRTLILRLPDFSLYLLHHHHHSPHGHHHCLRFLFHQYPLIPSPSLPLLPPLPVSAPPPASPIRPLGYRAAMIRLRAEAASTSRSLPLPPLSPIPALTPSLPLLLPSTNHREDRPKVTLLPQERLGIALSPRYKVGESSSAAAARPAGGLRADYDFVATMDREIRHDLDKDVRYRITDSWDEIVEAMQRAPVVTDVAEFSQRMTEFETRVRQDTDNIYTRLDDEQSEGYVVTYSGGSTAGSDYRATGSRPQEAGGDYRDA
ncbi:hypothetical protein Tco_0322807, partial [Tanacetum coccineum]